MTGKWTGQDSAAAERRGDVPERAMNKNSLLIATAAAETFLAHCQLVLAADSVLPGDVEGLERAREGLRAALGDMSGCETGDGT